MTHRTVRSARQGFGIATLFAVMIPALVLVVALAHMFQASTTRRITSAAYASYLSGEITESAIAEAAHLLSVRHLFSNVGNEATFTTTFMQQLLADQPAGVPADNRAYWSLVDDTGAEMQRMLVALAFDPQAPGQEIPLSGIAKAAAEQNPGVKIPGMRVMVKPVSFRREFISARGVWINWGVVTFQAAVTIDMGDGPEVHGQSALKMFTLRPSGQPGDVVMFSDRNLRTVMHRPGARRS